MEVGVCSTLLGSNTRRYHSLLTSATGSDSRVVLLSKVEEVLVLENRRFELSANRVLAARFRTLRSNSSRRLRLV